MLHPLMTLKCSICKCRHCQRSASWQLLPDYPLRKLSKRVCQLLFGVAQRLELLWRELCKSPSLVRLLLTVTESMLPCCRRIAACP